MLIALGVMMPMLRMRMAATKRTGKHADHRRKAREVTAAAEPTWWGERRGCGPRQAGARQSRPPARPPFGSTRVAAVICLIAGMVLGSMPRISRRRRPRR